MHTTSAPAKIRFKVGLFTVVGLAFVGVLTVYVNDKPYWYRPCQLVHISVEDATGLKTKSPVRSLGLEIGYLRSVELSESHVRLGICITADVEVLQSTRAYLRAEGFLGDKFVELKPVKYLGPSPEDDREEAPQNVQPTKKSSLRLSDFFISDAYAEEPVASPSPAPVPESAPPPPSVRRGKGKEIPMAASSQDMQALVGRVDSLVGEMTNLTTNLKNAINPEELRQTMRQLNKTLENASKTIAPEGGLNQTAQRALSKLEDAIEQLRLVMTRINKGEGSVGKFLNDPVYADEAREAIKNINNLLNRANKARFVVDVGGQKVRGYEGSRGWFRLHIWPTSDRYYLVGLSTDPRGRRVKLRTATTVAGGPTTTIETTTLEETGLLPTLMIGVVYWDRLNLSIGALSGDGAVTAGLRLGPADKPDRLEISHDIYSRGGSDGVDGRITATIRPFKATWMNAGLESYRKVEGNTALFIGGGVAFDDEDIKLLFALK